MLPELGRRARSGTGRRGGEQVDLWAAVVVDCVWMLWKLGDESGWMRGLVPLAVEVFGCWAVVVEKY